MNRIKKLFNNRKKPILSIYFTAGYPKINDTKKIINYLSKSGGNMIEIGIPFSDPIADGPVIQNSNKVALSNGMSLKLLLSQLIDLRETTDIPVILMGYINPIIQYGMEDFIKDSKNCGIDGFIIPDLPINIYEKMYKDIFESNDVCFIPLISPKTPDDRINLIDTLASGFIYMVSSSSVTGRLISSVNNRNKYFNRVNNLKLKNPTLVGFGIKDNKSFNQVLKYSKGVIIGTAFIDAITNSNDIENSVISFIRSVKNL